MNRAAVAATLLALIGCVPQQSVDFEPLFPVIIPSPLARVPSKVAPAEDSIPRESVSSPAAEMPKVHSLTGLLCGQSRHDLLMQFWPKSRVLETVRDEGILLYDEASMPRVYQVDDNGLAQVVRVGGEGQTANDEFPWSQPAGVAFNSNVKAFRFAHIPEGKPVIWWRGQRQNGSFSGFRWVFQEGTRFGEVLLVTDSRGFDHTFEVRTRVKRSDGTWSVQVYRPFPTEDSFREAMAERGFDLGNLPQSGKFIDTRLAQFGGHVRNFFTATGVMSTLPQMQEELVKDLLDREFLPCKGQEWSPGCAAPTAVGSFNIVPVGFLGGLIPVDNQSCMRCHTDAGNVVNLSGERRWRVRGNDAILSFHIFAPDSIGTGNVRLNERLVNAGLLVHAANLP